MENINLQLFANKIVYGLEKVHIAFKGVAQTETIEVTAPCSTDGEITVTVTADAILGEDSPKTVVVPLSTESHNTVTKVASAVVNILNNDSVINTKFKASYNAGVITLAAKKVADNDNTLAIAFTVGATGVTVGPSTNGAAGTTGWGVPIAIPGAVSLKPKAEGQSSTFYADNSPYFAITANNGYTGDLEIALIPDDVLAKMLNWEFDDNGMLVELNDAVPAEFALMGQILGDAKNRRFVYWNCTAARPEKEEKTKGESIEPNPDVLKITMAPTEIGGRRMTRGVMQLSDTNVDAYNAFFDSVYTPVFS